MELIELENIAKKEKLNIVNDKMKKNKARIIYDYIFMDYSHIHTYTEEKCLLAEEIGHYYYDAYYTLSSSQININRAEYKAMKWKSLACVSRQSILNCFMKRNNKYIRYSRRITSRTKYGAICLQLL